MSMKQMSLMGMTIAVLLIYKICLSQEICDNCIDDDNDGFIDCYDSDCNSNSSCPNFFIGSLEATELTPCNNEDPFLTDTLWTYSGLSATSLLTVGDIDNDGIVEIVVSLSNTIYIINGQTGTLENSLSGISGLIAIADVDQDGTAEIFVQQRKTISLLPPPATFKIYVYRLEHDLSISWIDSSYQTTNPAKPSIVDFDYNGTPELLVGGTIYDVSNGSPLININLELDVYPNRQYFTFAYDILPDNFCEHCEGHEIINGKKVFAVDISSGQTTLASALDDTMLWDKASLGDYDNDGQADIFMNADAPGPGDSRALYVWNPRLEKIISSVYMNNNLGYHQPVVADYNGNGEMEIGIQGRDTFFCF